MNSVVKGCVAEFIGMFLFVFFGCASIILMHSNPASSAGLATIALAHGLVMSALITGAMAISGGQFNPAVSIGLVVAGKQSPGQAAAFVTVQLVGAACAAGFLQLILTPAVANDEGVRLGATIGSLTKSGDTMAVLGLEAVTSFALMYAVLMATVDSRAPKLGGLCIGLTIAACILAVGAAQRRFDEPGTDVRTGDLRGSLGHALGVLGRAGAWGVPRGGGVSRGVGGEEEVMHGKRKRPGG